MVFTPVIPPSYTTDRQDLNDALEAMLVAFMVSQGYGVGRVFWSEFPDSMTGDGPMMVLGDVLETVKHTEGVRITTFTGSVVWVDWYTDRQEANDRINAWADHMRELFTANVRILGKGTLEQTGLVEGELSQGELIFTGPQLTYQWVVQEGGYVY